ncbi:MAG: hypothetical protein GWN71_43180, partial [Gammaproteobacteria bacterium]|nr:hypothetical protein [Gammaproteobacteria bacterium]
AVVDGVRNVRDDGGAGKPVLASVVGGADGSATLGCQGDERIPAHAFPEEIGRILGCIADYRDWRASDPGVFPDFDD